MLNKVDAVDHTSHFNRAAKLHFPPLATDLRRTEGLHKAARGLAKLDLRLGELLELLLERGLALRATLFDFFDAFVKSLQRNANRLDGFINRFLAFLQVALSPILIFFERGLGEVKERLIVLRKCL